MIASLGCSDIASLTLRSVRDVDRLDFGEDGAYHAYIVDSEATIGEHYTLCSEFQHWLKIYDDLDLAAEFVAATIKVYRSGQFGCIIQLLKD